MSSWKVTVAVTAALLALACAAPRLPGQTVPKKYHKTIDQGLTWLAAQQAADGSWSAQGQHKIPLTALAGSALAMDGGSVRDSKFANHIQKAAAFLMKFSQKNNEQDGLIGGQDEQDLRPLLGHGFALTFLARIYGDIDNRQYRNEFKDVLIRGAKYLEKTQSRQGGWYYVWNKGFDQNESTVTAVQLQALREMRNAGIPIPKEFLNKVRDYFQENTGPSGGIYDAPNEKKSERWPLAAAAFAFLGPNAGIKDEYVRKWLRHCQPFANAGLGFNEKFPNRQMDLGHYFLARGLVHLGDNGWDRRFGEGDPNRLTWSAYRTRLFDELQKQQQPNGSWGKVGGFGVGPVYQTALYLLILQVDNDVPLLLSNR